MATSRRHPQLFTRQGNNAVVLLAAPEYRRLAGEDALISLLRQAPRGEPLNTDRSPVPARPLDLGASW
jgi:PHD/YefM family antitoxin component YafN of YafNO toxin-antitoxin module